METRTASQMSSGQFKELASSVLEAIPTDLPKEVAQVHIGRKGRSHRMIEGVLRLDPSRVDWVTFEKALRPMPAIAQQMFQWRFVRSREHLTLVLPDGMKKEAGVERRLEDLYCEVVATGPEVWLTWTPDMPFIWGSRGRTASEQQGCVEELNLELPRGSGWKVKAVFPSLAQIIVVAHAQKIAYREWGSPSFDTISGNRTRCRLGDEPPEGCWLCLGLDRSLQIIKFKSESATLRDPDLGVLRFAVVKPDSRESES